MVVSIVITLPSALRDRTKVDSTVPCPVVDITLFVTRVEPSQWLVLLMSWPLGDLLILSLPSSFSIAVSERSPAFRVVARTAGVCLITMVTLRAPAIALGRACPISLLAMSRVHVPEKSGLPNAKADPEKAKVMKMMIAAARFIDASKSKG